MAVKRALIAFKDLVAKHAALISSKRDFKGRFVKRDASNSKIRQKGGETSFTFNLGGAQYDVSVPSESAGTPIRDHKGKMRKAGSMRALLQRALTVAVAQNHGDKYFNLRTGRFTESVNIDRIKVNNETNRLSLAFSYMTAPYSVFDSNYPLHTSDQRYHTMRASYGNPSDLILDSLAKVMKQVVWGSYTLTVRDSNSENSAHGHGSGFVAGAIRNWRR